MLCVRVMCAEVVSFVLVVGRRWLDNRNWRMFDDGMEFLFSPWGYFFSACLGHEPRSNRIPMFANVCSRNTVTVVTLCD